MLGYDEPILFVEILAAESNNRQQFKVTEQAQDFFRALSDKKVELIRLWWLELPGLNEQGNLSWQTPY